MGFNSEGISLGVVGPYFDGLIFGGAGELVAQRGKFDISDCILTKYGSTLCPMYL